MPGQEQDPLDHYFRTRNPNPGRIGCPSPAVLQAVARRATSVPAEVFTHLAGCSECWADVEAHRARVARRRRLERFALGAVAVAAAIAGLILFIPQAKYFHFQSSLSTAKVGSQNVAINLFDEETLRGGGRVLRTIYIPPSSVRLIITLPRFSRPGSYQVSLCRDRTDASCFARTGSKAISEGSREMVTVAFDLALVSKGSYWLSIRHDQDDGSNYFPVKLS